MTNDQISKGRKMRHGVMKAKGINIGEPKTGKTLCEINPEARRSNVGSRSLNVKVYNAKYLVHKIHYDQNKKSGMFGVAHVCALDGFSSKIVGHATMARKNKLLIYEEVFRLMITFFIHKYDVFGLLKYFEVSYSPRNSLQCIIKASQLVFYNGTSFS